MKIGKYEIVRLLGKGGMSEVYEVLDPEVGARHALKAYTYKNEDDEVRQRFVAEGRLLARLSHPRIVKVSDIGEDAGRPFFVMDLVLDPDGEKRSLADVPEGSADEQMIGRWYDDIRDALAYIHSKGVVHRDLKLQNVMIGPDSHAVLTDFGISKIFDTGASGADKMDAVNTIVNLRDGRRPVMGSLGYMAPELEMGAEATPESDWYALGVIVYKLLTGTWCDSRTDVTSALGTYDRAWLAIVPKLLHSNPKGRECLSYAEEHEREREKAEAKVESRYLREKARGHLARHVARYAMALSIIAAGVSGALGYKLYRTQRRLFDAETRLSMPTFETVFKLPAVVRNQDGEAFARSDLEDVQIDAWVLTHKMFADLADGKITLDEAKEILKRIHHKVMKEEADDLWGDYQSNGDDELLRELFRGAVKRMVPVRRN